jgi:predicted nucleic acid-binding protein
VILDTNALSAFADGSPQTGVALRDAVNVAVPVIVLGEYRYGVRHSTRRREYEAWLERNLPTFRVLEITTETALVYSAIRSELRALGKPIPANDAWIAALCRQHDLPILSRDRHFDHVKGLRRLAW